MPVHNPLARFSGYPESYHSACNALVNHSLYGSRATMDRKIIARALRDLRARYGREFARRAWYHLHQIAGQFPVKKQS